MQNHQITNFPQVRRDLASEGRVFKILGVTSSMMADQVEARRCLDRLFQNIAFRKAIVSNDSNDSNDGNDLNQVEEMTLNSDDTQSIPDDTQSIPEDTQSIASNSSLFQRALKR